MVFCTVVFGPIVYQVADAKTLVKSELNLCHSVPEPVELYVHGLHLFWMDFVVDEAIGCCVVSLHWRWWLRLSHFIQYVSDVGGFFGIDKEGSHLSFCSG